MRRYIALTVLGIGAIWMAWTGGRMAGPGGVADASNFSTQPQGLGMKFAGSWLCDLYLGGSPPSVQLFLTLTSDGTFVVGGGQSLPGGATLSTAHGSWKALGWNKLIGTAVSMGYNPDTTLGWYEKGPLNLTLSADGNTLEGTLSIGLYAADQDPLGDENPANGTIPCTMICRRIKAQ